MFFGIEIMEKTEWDRLVSMRNEIQSSNIQSFDSLYLEEYAELLSKSLEGKGDRPLHSRSHNSMV
jgi:hypothetical protein